MAAANFKAYCVCLRVSGGLFFGLINAMPGFANQDNESRVTRSNELKGNVSAVFETFRDPATKKSEF